MLHLENWNVSQLFISLLHFFVLSLYVFGKFSITNEQKRIKIVKIYLIQAYPQRGYPIDGQKNK